MLSGSALRGGEERRFVLMFGCRTWSCLEHVGEDEHFRLVEGDAVAWFGRGGGSLLFPTSGFYRTKGLGFFTIWEGLFPLGWENSAWTRLELL